MRPTYWQVERLCGGDWLGTDWYVSGATAADADGWLADRSADLGWTLRRGRVIEPPEHNRYCSISWAGMP